LNFELPEGVFMSLPSNLVIKLGKWVWTTMWHQMMSRLAPRSASGAYVRPESEFRGEINNEEDNIYQPEKGRYCLYVGLSCPWAHRTLIVRALKGLEDVIPVIWVVAKATEGGWILEKPDGGCDSLAQVYRRSQKNYQGRATVPMLWDNKTQTVVNNESSEIVKLLNRQFNQWAKDPELDLYPTTLQAEIDALNEKIYHNINNGVYRCGLAQSQAAYEEACRGLFMTLDELEERLSSQSYLFGDQITLADVWLFPTLFRFDAVYYHLFKCSLRRIEDYSHLQAYLQRIYQLSGISDICNLEQVKQDYYTNLFPLNPSGIIPLS
jgi:glutathionyl-hydroquinone reductase